MAVLRVCAAIFNHTVRSANFPARKASARDFRERAAIFDRTFLGVLSPPHTSRAPGFATQDHARARDSNAAQGNTQDTEATLANLLRKECQGCSETRRPSRPASRIQSSGAIVTSQPWIQLTGGYARLGQAERIRATPNECMPR